MADALLDLLAARSGHFQMESGFHSERWFDLDRLFAEPRRLQPFVVELAARLARYRVEAVCGPMSGGAKLAALVARELGLPSYAAARTEADDAAAKMFAVRYTLSAEDRQHIGGCAVAIVDDAISAGSAVRGTFADLVNCGARPVVIGALIVFGDKAQPFATGHGLALEGLVHTEFAIWAPPACPLCRTGVPVERISDAVADLDRRSSPSP
jgi:orotate phosphoribosyltransferase